MNKLRKLTCLLLALMMVFAMTVTASAADGESTITAPDGSTRTYEVYQIFVGDLDPESKVLSNVKWGKNGTGTEGALVDEATLNALTAVNSTNSDADKMAVIEQYVKLSSDKFGEVKAGHPLTVRNGYYLIKDVGPVNEGETYSRYIVNIVENITIAPKVSNVTFHKKIKDTNDTAGTTTDWQDSADYDIGDSVPFQLTGTVATDFAEYKSAYYFAFHDKMEPGLTFEPNSVKVYVGGTEISTDYYTLNQNPNDGCTFDVVFEDLKGINTVHANSKITVEFTAQLNDQAVLGKRGNVNEARLEYSNKPYDEQGGTTYTKWDSVIAFTYQVVVNKYANEVKEGNERTGAEFTLEKKLANGEKKSIAVVKNTDGTTFTFKGLDDGDYILTETVTPSGFNTIDPIEFTVTADHTVTWNGEDRTTILTSLSGNVTTGQIAFTASEDNGTLNTNVINKSGSTLPETGGMGTTLFYVLGGVLVLAAVVLLVTKKRMRSEN